jgi:hypothetical protein
MDDLELLEATENKLANELLERVVQRANEVFETHGHAETLFVSDDLNVFQDRQYAIQHLQNSGVAFRAITRDVISAHYKEIAAKETQDRLDDLEAAEADRLAKEAAEKEEAEKQEAEKKEKEEAQAKAKAEADKKANK